MEPRFTRGEYWLLETVVEHELEICALVDDDLELHLNKKGHGLTRASLVETFYRLLSLGLIYAKNEEMGFILTAEQIELALDEPKRWVGVPVDEREVTYYGLTQEGGAQWEAFAAPDWEKYITASFQLTDNGEYEIWELICGNKDWGNWGKADKNWLEAYIESMCFYNQKELFLASIAWDSVTPWQATYWKQLDGGHRVRFRCQDKNGEGNFKPPYPPWGRYFYQTWYAWQ
ncbi:hypothetical protein C6503_06825 [Candidatus Poribacteria bacterium]|nr:MAG: hypothetical protein C6503_06825 [Candidatus Poribacteria bacterium]